MSSTLNVQSLLTNVFRPVYTYSASGFATNVELSNVDTVSANTARLFRADIADAGSNVYVGLNSGNSWLTVRSCCNTTAVGYGAAANCLSVSNSVYIGTLAGANSSSNSRTIAIGCNAGQSSTGSSNIFIGAGTGTPTGNNNVFIGNGLTATSTPYTSNQCVIGTGNTVALAADLAYGCVAIGKSDTMMGYLTLPAVRFPSLNLDVAGYARIQNGLAIGRDPGGASVDIAGDFRTDDGYGSLRFTHDQSTSNSSLTAVSSNNLLFTHVFPNQCGVYTIPNTSSLQTIPMPGLRPTGIVIANYSSVAGSVATQGVYIQKVTPDTDQCYIQFGAAAPATGPYPYAGPTYPADTITWFAPKMF